MSFPAIHFPGTHHAPHSFSRRLAQACHAIAVRLAAARERHAAEAAERKLERARARDAEALNRLASQYERFSPNLSAELRYLAARG